MSKAMPFTRTGVIHCTAPIGDVFPLLCPKREEEWIPGWECETIWSTTGYNEPGAIFRTLKPYGTQLYWTTLQYDMALGRVDFLITAPGLFMFRFTIEVTAEGDGGVLALVFRQVFTPVSAQGATLIDRYRNDDYAGRLRELETFMTRHLAARPRRTGAKQAAAGEALLVIDVQNVYFTGRLPVTHPPESLARILEAMDHAAAAGIPVVIVQHGTSAVGSLKKGSPDWELHPEVARRKHDALIEKNLPGSFTGTNLETWLRERNIGRVAIAGYMTQMCCDTTARQASHLGFGVDFLSDATGTLAISNAAGSVTAEELHRAILVTQAMRFARVLTARQWIEAPRG